MNQENELSFAEQLENLPDAIAFRKLIEDQKAWVEDMNRKEQGNAVKHEKLVLCGLRRTVQKHNLPPWLDGSSWTTNSCA